MDRRGFFGRIASAIAASAVVTQTVEPFGSAQPQTLAPEPTYGNIFVRERCRMGDCLTTSGTRTFGDGKGGMFGVAMKDAEAGEIVPCLTRWTAPTHRRDDYFGDAKGWV